MKKIMTSIVLIGLLFSMAAAKSSDKKDAKPSATAVDNTKSFEGWISDEKCGANINAACSKTCRSAGAKLVFVGSDKTVTPIANQESVNGFVGQHVNIHGKLQNGVLTITNVKAANK